MFRVFYCFDFKKLGLCIRPSNQLWSILNIDTFNRVPRYVKKEVLIGFTRFWILVTFYWYLWSKNLTQFPMEWSIITHQLNNIKYCHSSIEENRTYYFIFPSFLNYMKRTCPAIIIINFQFDVCLPVKFCYRNRVRSDFSNWNKLLTKCVWLTVTNLRKCGWVLPSRRFHPRAPVLVIETLVGNWINET